MPQQLVSLLPMIVAFAALYFFLILPQKKKEKQFAQMRSGLRVGDEILTVGGIKGKIIKSGQDFITVETAGKTRLEFTKNAVYKLLTEEEKRKSLEETEVQEVREEE